MATELDVVRVTHDKIGSYADWFSNGDDDMATVIRKHDYAIAKIKPNYPMPAIDYYNSNHPVHVAIGNLMEWTIPVDVQLKHRS